MPWAVTTLIVDAATGMVTTRAPFSEQSVRSQAGQIIRYAHTGQVGGLVGQGLAGLTCLVGALMVWTGIALPWRRLVRPVLRRLRGTPVPAQ